MRYGIGTSRCDGCKFLYERHTEHSRTPHCEQSTILHETEARWDREWKSCGKYEERFD
jgi:hypothetical protein